VKDAVVYAVGSDGRVWGFDAVVSAMMTARKVASHRMLHAFPEDLVPRC
jgi:hypothetical protein